MEGGTRQRFLIVRVGSVTCAVPLTAVRRVLSHLSVVPVPGARPQLLGLAQWGGEPLAVLDLQALVGEGEESSTRERVTVVVRVGQGPRIETVGLAVDAVQDVIKVEQDAIAQIGHGFVSGEIALADDVVRMLDLAALGTDQ